MTRGFKVANGFENAEINLPTRATKNSGGYDFESAEDVVIPSIWKSAISNLLVNVLAKSPKLQNLWDRIDIKFYENPNTTGIKPTLVKTGVKAYMGEDEVLYLYNRSSNPLKKFLLLGNGVGVVDSDYYENPDNDGHIMFQFINFGLKDVTIKKGERIGQGVFGTFLKADNDTAGGERQGGFGSTN